MMTRYNTQQHIGDKIVSWILLDVSFVTFVFFLDKMSNERRCVGLLSEIFWICCQTQFRDGFRPSCIIRLTFTDWGIKWLIFLWGCGSNMKGIIIKLIIHESRMENTCEIALMWIPQNLTKEKSTLVRVISWCTRSTYGACDPRECCSASGVTVGLGRCVHSGINHGNKESLCCSQWVLIWFVLRDVSPGALVKRSQWGWLFWWPPRPSLHKYNAQRMLSSA